VHIMCFSPFDTILFLSHPLDTYVAIESFDDDDEAEAADKEEYLTDLEEIKEEGKSIV